MTARHTAPFDGHLRLASGAPQGHLKYRQRAQHNGSMRTTQVHALVSLLLCLGMLHIKRDKQKKRCGPNILLHHTVYITPHLHRRNQLLRPYRPSQLDPRHHPHPASGAQAWRLQRP